MERKMKPKDVEELNLWERVLEEDPNRSFYYKGKWFSMKKVKEQAEQRGYERGYNEGREEGILDTIKEVVNFQDKYQKEGSWEDVELLSRLLSYLETDRLKEGKETK
jgi:flagellar biosynthesis/type III secretory pathway protein FliH